MSEPPQLAPLDRGAAVLLENIKAAILKIMGQFSTLTTNVYLCKTTNPTFLQVVEVGASVQQQSVNGAVTVKNFWP